MGQQQGRNSPRRPRNAGGRLEGSRGPLPLGKKEILALGPTSADNLILIHQVNQGYVNRRNAA